MSIRSAPVCLFLLAGAACSDSSGPAGERPLVEIVFTASPMQLDHIYWIPPLGGLNPPGHTIPNDHTGFYHMDLGNCPCTYVERPVYAPAAGTVRKITSTYDGLEVGEPPDVPDSHKQPWYYIGHITLDPTIRVGDRVEPGQLIGTTTHRSPAIDFGLVHPRADNYFVVRARYTDKALFGDKPFRRFTEPLRSQLYAKVRRSGPDKDGRFDYDIAGRLVGGWFHESLPRDYNSTMPDGWTRNLAFVYSDAEPDEPRVVVGGTIADAGIWRLTPGDPDFRAISTASGPVRFHVWSSGPYNPARAPDRVLLVQLTSAERLLIEVFPGTAEPTSFTSNAKVYLR